MKRFLTIFFIISIVALCISIITAQPEMIILKNSDVFKGKQRSAVEFPHGIHMEGDLGCIDCHHQYQNGKNILDEDELEEGNPKIKCANCHTGNSGSNYNLMEAFHKQCLGCHRSLFKAGKKTGPRLCGECHPKK
ncbi:MAG: cytochrome c3 family protein [Spirochaetota bacterium]|nr:cytochrome c3 family protein [Spirochaetota bacterium]